MKNLLLICTLFAGTATGRLIAQELQTADREKMKIFSHWVGHWRGEGIMQMGAEAKRSQVEEKIESKLDGLVLLVEGIGKAIDPSTQQEMVVHHALALLSFDEVSGEYKFRTHLRDGRSTDAWFKVVGENKYQWGFDTPRGKIRYNIHVDPSQGTWNETGEFSRDGTAWRKFFEMNLVKVG